MENFIISDYRHEKLKNHGIFLCFRLDPCIPESSLRGTLTSSQAETVLSLAKVWIEEFVKFNNDDVDNNNSNINSSIGINNSDTIPSSSTNRLNDLELDDLYVSAQKKRKSNSFRRDVLLGSILEECPSKEGKLNISLEVILAGMDSPRQAQLSISTFTQLLAEAQKIILEDDLFERLNILGEDLFACLISPFRSSGNRTPTVRSIRSNVSAFQPSPDQGTEGRLRNLRSVVMKRDQYRCKISGTVDGLLAEQIPSHIIAAENITFGDVKCAHIIPHSLNELGGQLELSEQRKLVWSLLNMFCPGLSAQLRGTNIDKASNALILSKEVHSLFGRLLIWFNFVEETEDLVKYRIEASKDYIKQSIRWPDRGEVIFWKMDKTCEIPSRSFFEVHRALSIVASLSGAAERIEVLDREQEQIKEMCRDGSHAGLLHDMLLRNLKCFSEEGLFTLPPTRLLNSRGLTKKN